MVSVKTLTESLFPKSAKKEAVKKPFRFAYTEAFTKKKEAATSGGVAGGALTRAGVKSWL